MDLTTALDWAAARNQAVLVTLRADGRAQSSDINYVVDDGVLLISVTDSRAKTRNMRRDDRVVVHISDRSTWSYISFDGTAELLPVAKDPHDATVEALVDMYRKGLGEHPDWDEYRQAMVADGRLVARVTPTSAVGMING